MLDFDFEMDTHALGEKILRLTNIKPSEIREKVTKPAAEVIKEQINQDLYSLAKTHSADGGLKEDLVIVDKESSNGSTAVGYSKDGYYYRLSLIHI